MTSNGEVGTYVRNNTRPWPDSREIILIITAPAVKALGISRDYNYTLLYVPFWKDIPG